MNLLRVVDTDQTVVRKHVDATELRAKLAAEARRFWAVEKAPMEPSLIYTQERSGNVQVTPIREGITVGRSTKCTICLQHSGDLSRIHFLVRPEDGNWVMEDLGSVNGTTVEGLEAPVMKHTLRHGDLVFAAEQMFLFMNPRDEA